MTIGEKLLGAESRWVMGSVMPYAFLHGIGHYLEEAVPDHDDELIAAIRDRGERLIAANQDMIVDKPSEGALALGAIALAAFETLLPVFDGNERRTILYLQHVMGLALKRATELIFATLNECDNPLDKIEIVCRKEQPLYGAGWDIDYRRPNPKLFEMKVKRCFWHDFFARHDAALVTTVLCAWDTNWMAAIASKPSKTAAASALSQRAPRSGSKGKK